MAAGVCQSETPQTWASYAQANQCNDSTAPSVQPAVDTSRITIPKWASGGLSSSGTFNLDAALKSTYISPVNLTCRGHSSSDRHSWMVVHSDSDSNHNGHWRGCDCRAAVLPVQASQTEGQSSWVATESEAMAERQLARPTTVLWSLCRPITSTAQDEEGNSLGD